MKINNQGYKGIVHFLETIQVRLTHKLTWISKSQFIDVEPRVVLYDLFTSQRTGRWKSNLYVRTQLSSVHT